MCFADSDFDKLVLSLIVATLYSVSIVKITESNISSSDSYKIIVSSTLEFCNISLDLLSFAKYTSPEVPEFKVHVSYLSVNVETISNLDHCDQSRGKSATRFTPFLAIVSLVKFHPFISSNAVQSFKLLLLERHEITELTLVPFFHDGFVFLVAGVRWQPVPFMQFSLR